MTARSSDSVLMVAARAPYPGATKTRLGRTIGMDRAARLYSAFLVDLAAKLTTDPDDHRPYDLVWTHSPPGIDFRRELCEAIGNVPADTRFLPQIADEDWGRRQSALLEWGDAQGYARSVLIASDSPQIDIAVISEAFASLVTNDVVIGRVHDGGYYLIGQRGYREILKGVEMSTASAADGVIEHARRLGLVVAEVQPTFDVDVEGDLDLLREHLGRCEGRDAPATWRALLDLGLR